MEINKVLVTGDRDMIRRHQFLFNAMSSYSLSIDYLPIDSLYNLKLLKNLARKIHSSFPFFPVKRASSLRKTHHSFVKKSQQAEQKIKKLKYTPDLVFHLYGMFSPFQEESAIPYTTYLDYTMALARKNWGSWAPFKTEEAFLAWIECERKAYKNASHIFAKSGCVKTSLIKNYNIKPENITVIHSSGQFSEPYQGEKKFSSNKILFNGSDFERKGGDLLVAAFKQVRQAIPEAQLIIVGEKLSIDVDGVYNPGRISSPSEMKKLFLDADLVVSPARCEPLGLFLIESMNYGIPCIVTAQDGMPEIIEHQVNGIVLDRSNSDLLAGQIIDLLSSRSILEMMSKNARHKVQKQYNWRTIASRISEVLSSI